MVPLNNEFFIKKSNLLQLVDRKFADNQIWQKK